MQPVPAMSIPQRFVAAAVRAENLDALPHPCTFFIDGSYLRQMPRGHIRLITKPITNFAGFTCDDFFFEDSVARDELGRQLWYPLMRTNTWNPHPIVGAVYGHMFYHHGAGSRSPAFRVIETGIYRHVVTEEQLQALEHNLYEMLCSDPERLCGELAAAPADALERTGRRPSTRP
jgi:hypothetical protein